jgi:histidinol-phosphate aminotransferase
MKSIEEFIVPWVREAESYSDKHMDFAWEHPDILRMMSNENLLTPSPSVLDAVMAAAKMGNLYPGSGKRVRELLGKRAGLTADNVILGNGSTDVINFIIHTFVAPGEDVVISVPTFPMYVTRTRINGGNPILVPMTPDFYWDVDAILIAVTPKTKLIFICSPNNPTGNMIKDEDLKRILDLGVPTFLDEAYFELETEPKSRTYLFKDYPNLIINRTLSKAYGIAGMRVGYALADEKIIAFFNRSRIPWNVSLLALAAAEAVLQDEEDHQRKRKNTIEGRKYLIDQLDEIPGIKAYPSEGNFVLFDASCLGKTSLEIRDDIIARGVFIRPMEGHQTKAGFMRVTVGTPEMNERFIKIFRQYIEDVIATKRMDV